MYVCSSPLFASFRAICFQAAILALDHQIPKVQRVTVSRVLTWQAWPDSQEGTQDWKIVQHLQQSTN